MKEDDWSLKDNKHLDYDWDKHMDNIIHKVYYSEEVIETLRKKLIEDIMSGWIVSNSNSEYISRKEVKKIINRRFGVD